MQLSRGVLSLLTVAILFLVLGAVAGWRILAEGEGSTTSQQDELPSTEGVEVSSASMFSGVQSVLGVEVVRDTLWVRVVADGRAEAYRRSVVSTRTDGVVQSVLVQESDFVEAGDVLIQLDTVEAAMELAEAEAELESATIEFEGRRLAGGLVEDPAIREERERNLRAQTGLIPAEMRVQRARMELDLTRVTAPFAGRVADLTAVEGEYLTTGTEVLTLVQLDPIKVRADVLESDLSYLDSGRRGTVRFSANPGQVHDALIQSVNPLVDEESGSARVTLVLPNPDGRIRPGMFASVRIDGEALPNRIIIPREAVVERNQPRIREVVFMLQDADENGSGRAEWRYVATGRRNETHVEILPLPEAQEIDTGASELEPGEIVLVDGHHYLAHDTQVQLIEQGDLEAVEADQ